MFVSFDHVNNAAKRLINLKRVQVIIGPHTWQETSQVAEVSTRSKIPTFSLTDSTPIWAMERWPYLVQASISNQAAQMKAVAAIVQSWGWRQVNIIYEEDINSATGGVIPALLQSLQEVGAEISHLVPLQTLTTSSLSDQLTRLKGEQCRVFVVHTSLILAIHLFQKAEEMKMMEKDYIWIVTSTISDFLHSLNLTTIYSMQGVVGVRRYYPQTSTTFVGFKNRFQKKFSSYYPEEGNNEPGISAVETYDALWAVSQTFADPSIMLLEKIPFVDFYGMTGRVQFIERKVIPSHMFGVVNVIGKSYTELGIWSEGLGFSKSIDDNAAYNSCMRNLGQVFWPGKSLYTPKGWTLFTKSDFWRIGVPTEEIMFKQRINILYDPQTNNSTFTGYVIDTFNEVMARLPYHVPYNFVPFNGTFDALVEQVYLKVRASSHSYFPFYYVILLNIVS